MIHTRDRRHREGVAFRWRFVSFPIGLPDRVHSDLCRPRHVGIRSGVLRRGVGVPFPAAMIGEEHALAVADCGAVVVVSVLFGTVSSERARDSSAENFELACSWSRR